VDAADDAEAEHAIAREVIDEAAGAGEEPPVPLPSR
jgi:hypothetical protein